MSEKYSGHQIVGIDLRAPDADSNVIGERLDELAESFLTWAEFDHIDIPALITSHLGYNGGAWNLRNREPWLVVEPFGYRSRSAGWKLHLSSTAASAQQVLGAAVGVLARRQVAFKVPATTRQLRRLVVRDCDRAQAGKIVTIYPDNDEQFVILAAELHEATTGMAGPRILSDRPYRPGSLVHYRYGGFAGQAKLTLDGVYEQVLITPDGATIPDRRDARYTPPRWAVCPLPDQPSAQRTDRATSVLLDERFSVTGSLRQSAKGGVYLATDAETGAEVVVKHSRAHMDADGQGADARDGLRHEARMLRLLAPTGLVPALVTTFEQDGDLFLVEEVVDGDPLRSWVAEHAIGRPGVPPAVALPMATKLVELMEQVHAHGVVIRDLSPTNVLVTPDGELRLVDLETAAPVGSLARWSCTVGYQAPELIVGRGAWTHATATFAEDRFSLGAMLFLIATGNDPVLADDEPAQRSIRERLAGWLAGVAPHSATVRALRPAILNLTGDDPATRRTPPPFDKADDATGTWGRDGLGEPDLDRLIADGLSHLMATGTAQPAERLWPTSTDREQYDPASVQHGAAGVLGALTAGLVRAPGDGELADAVRTAVSWLECRVAREPRLLPGLQFGRSGTAWALYDAACALRPDDGGLADRAGELLLRIPLPDRANPDVAHGLAGAGLAHLHLAHSTGDERFTQRAVRCADGVAGAAERDADILLFPVPADLDSQLAGTRHYGFAHGTAGGGYFLLAAGELTGVTRYTELALEAADTLCRVAVLDDGAAWWPAGPTEGNLFTYWCSGSAGIGSFLLRAWQVSQRPRYAELAEQAALAVYRTRWLDLPSACHGLAGNGEFLLDAAGILGERRFAKQASELAAVAYLRHSLRRGRMVTCGENGRDVVADAGVGMSGMVEFLLRCRDGGARGWMVDEVFASRPALRARGAVA
ncbi:MAG: class IV lanthionine synthetase LanL [Pseudonocardiaceae bacterium]